MNWLRGFAHWIQVHAILGLYNWKDIQLFFLSSHSRFPWISKSATQENISSLFICPTHIHQLHVIYIQQKHRNRDTLWKRAVCMRAHTLSVTIRCFFSVASVGQKSVSLFLSAVLKTHASMQLTTCSPNPFMDIILWFFLFCFVVNSQDILSNIWKPPY